MVGARRDRLRDLLERVALDLDGRGPASARGRASTASAMPMPARWLSLTSTHVGQRAAVVHAAAGAHRRLLERRAARAASCGCPRSAPSARRRSTNRRVSVATPEQVAQEVERGALAGEHRPQRPGDRRRRLVPGADGVAVVDAASRPARVGSSCANTSVAHAVPGEHAVGARRRRRRPRAPSAATSAAVRSPSGPRSSASARATDVAHDVRRGGSSVAVIALGSGTSAGSGTNVGRRVAGEHEPAEELGRRLGEVEPRVRAARLLAARSAAAHERAAHREQVRAPRRRSAAHRRRARVDGARSRLVGVAQHAGVARHDPLQLVARSTAPAARGAAPTARPSVRRRRDAAQHAGRLGRVLARRRSPRRRARANTRPSSSEFDASRFAPCTPEHAASPHAHRPGSVVAPSRSVHDAAREVVRRGRDREPVAASGRARRAAHGRQIVGNRVGKSSIAGGVEPEVVEAAVDEPAADRPGHDVARREVGERVLVGHERDAVLVAQDRALAAQRLGEQRPRHRRVVQRGRVELHELDVGDRDTGPQRHRDAVAGRERRVGGDREALPGATGRDDRVRARARSLGAVGVERAHADARGRPRRAGRRRASRSRTSTPRAPAPRRRAPARSRRRWRRRPRARPAATE